MIPFQQGPSLQNHWPAQNLHPCPRQEEKYFLWAEAGEELKEPEEFEAVEASRIFCMVLGCSSWLRLVQRALSLKCLEEAICFNAQYLLVNTVFITGATVFIRCSQLLLN